LFSSLLCTFSPEGSSISVPIWVISQEDNFRENTLLDSLHRWLFSPLNTVGSSYNLNMLFFLMLSRYWTVEIRNKHLVYKLCFSHSRSTSLRSVRLNPCFWKFHHLMKLIFGYYTYNDTLQLDRMDCLKYYSFVIYRWLKLLSKLVLCELKQP
jgi:hypothetical protein